MKDNVGISWGMGTKSFYEVLSREKGKHRRQDMWMEEQRGRELSTLAVGIAYIGTLLEAQQHPEREYLVCYMNNEEVTGENPYNAPFRAKDNWEKTVDVHDGMAAIAAMALLKLKQYQGNERPRVQIRPLKRQSWVPKREGQRYTE